jgi:hypothetical protein
MTEKILNSEVKDISAIMKLKWKKRDELTNPEPQYSEQHPALDKYKWCELVLRHWGVTF